MITFTYVVRGYLGWFVHTLRMRDIGFVSAVSFPLRWLVMGVGRAGHRWGSRHQLAGNLSNEDAGRILFDFLLHLLDEVFGGRRPVKFVPGI